MKKFFIIMLCLISAAIAGYGIKYAVTPVNTQKLEYTTHENKCGGSAFVIREEWVMYSRSAGTAYRSPSEGDRVPKDGVIGTLFYGDVSADKIKELAVIDRKIQKARAGSWEGISALDLNTVESNIYKRENDIIEAAGKNDIYTISEYKEDINSLRENNTLSGSNNLAELENQRAQIIEGIGLNSENITAQISGMFTTYVDGNEAYFKPEDIEKYDVSYFESLDNRIDLKKLDDKINAGGPVCKIVNNHVWYVMTLMSEEAMKDSKEGESVRVRFNGGGDETGKAQIYHISEPQNGNVVVTLKSTEYIERAFSYRYANVDLIFQTYNGYKVPVHAIRTDNDGQKVIGINGSNRYDCYCDVLYTNTDEGYAIVESTEKSTHKLSQMERIQIGER